MDWKNKLHAIDNKIRNQLFSRKYQNFLWITKCAQQYDQGHTGKLTTPNLNLFLNKAGIFLSTQELRTIRDNFDYDKNGQIAYIDFLRSIKDNITERVMKAIKQVFDFLDQQGKGYITLDHIFSRYKSADHPHTQTRKKFQNQIFDEFGQAITFKAGDGVGLTEQQFFDYYSELGVCIPSQRQDYFVNLILSTWGLKEGKYYVSEQRLRQLQIILYEKIRQRQMNELNTAKTAFKYFDLADSGFCSLQNFTKALDKFGCKFAEHEIWTLFTKYDTSNDGLLSYNQFCQMLIQIQKPQNINPLTTLGQNSIGFKQLRI